MTDYFSLVILLFIYVLTSFDNDLVGLCVEYSGLVGVENNVVFVEHLIQPVSVIL